MIKQIAFLAISCGLKSFSRCLIGFIAALGSVAAFAQTPYEIIEAILPDEPAAPLIFNHLNNAGQIAGGFNRVGGELFIARWEPGKTNLTEVRVFRPGDFDAPPGVTLTGVSILALYHSGDALIALTGVQPLNPHQRHPLTQRSYAQKGYTRVMHYSAGMLRTVREFETWGGVIATRAFSDAGNGKFIFCEYGGDDYYTRFPADASGFSWNEHLPHYPEVWKMSDLSGAESLLPTGIHVLNQPTDYRYQTFFNHMDAAGNIYALATFRADPLTSFGRPITRSLQEVWVNGYPQSLADFAGPAAGAMLISHVNRDGEITGLFGPLSSRNAALYLPRANYGLGAGAHTITTSGSGAVSRMNRQGALVYDGQQGMLWTGGVSTPLDSLLPPASTPHPLVAHLGHPSSSALLNDRGWILTSSRNPDPLATDRYRYWLLRPVADAEAFLSTNRVQVGETFTFTLRVRNLTGTPRTLGLPIGFRFTGTARFQLVGNSTPPGTRVVPAFGSFEVQQQIRATNAGVSTWYSQGRLIGGGTTNNTAQAYSQPIHVVNYGDLLIKRAAEPEALFSGNDIYEKSPLGPQMRLVSQGPGETNRFTLRMQNDAQQPASFVLRVVAGPNPADWQVVVRDAASNVLASALAPGGWPAPELAPGASLDLSLEISDVSAKDQDQVTVTASLSNPSDAEIIDAVAAVAAREPVPVEIGLRRIVSGGYTAESIQAGLTNADAALELVADPATLAAQPLIHGGWVADGVTPLLLQLNSFPGALAFYPEGREFRLDLRIENGGSLASRALPDGLQLLRNGSWLATNRFTLTSGEPSVFATLPPVAADGLQLSSARELVLSATVTDLLTQRIVNQLKFRLRKPPVVLIHGYNTTGDWDDAFILELSRSRPPGVDEPAWVRVARYGQTSEAGRSPYVTQLVNTLWPLADLVPLADSAFEQAVAPLREQWAFTRFDAVCHSQGGLLTRMLCSERASRTLTRPFRNELNHYRGRFHRVVTIGSPHNGTRLLRYLLALNHSEFNRHKNALPLVIGKAGVFLEIAQDKFDPFGVQIRDLNNPSPDSRWKPDPAAKFHLVRTTINRGGPPSPYDDPPVPSYLSLGLLQPLAGPAVLPRGSDGVVDFDSMGAHGPNQTPAASVFQLTPELLISHSPPLDVFGAGIGQTASPDVGAHVIAALDQNPSVAPGERVFGSFVLPVLLDDTLREQIDHWANVPIFEYIESAINPEPGNSHRRPRDAGPTSTLRFALSTPPHLPLTNSVIWTLESFTANGVQSEPALLTVDPSDPRRVTVHVPLELTGDLVLYASYQATNGATVLAQPRRVFSAQPPGATLAGIEVEPNDVALPIGSELPIQVWARYSDGSVIQRYILPEEIIVSATPASVVVTTNSTAWRLVQPGTASVIVAYQSVSTTNQLTAYAPIPPDAPTLRVTQAAPGTLTIDWSPTTPGFILQESWALTPPAWTNSLSGTNNPAVVPSSASRRFYRLFKP